ncbi:hypothetical protein PQJ75_08985 [Rhodoplanes sp. TEM]|uniref:Uncharacterized protein n=1 Tax=Rhodoplanes tepidamans TaxID=200616 RepID=A0ABT5JLA2_RHOTP|nr:MULTISPECIES: hypothetical protein [Rhodoplanes]MDC7789996.1 hypothetical protein [Rhodoplanes tepidamans]MDC7983862.1 hypothetical protein [Rhodoplanes sp. TEM]MDQ0354298.1 hypothetical protein [Rhodoplanes tepidamans]
MDAPKYSDMSSEELLTMIEDAQAALDQKIAAERAELEERQAKLAELQARIGGKDAGQKPSAPRPRGRPPRSATPRTDEQLAPAP